MQLGFVIDQSRCIGCHACTVACKSENAVPVGNFRTWVKYTEKGVFPQVKRSFSVLRCNQCTDAPCVEICPVAALAKREDGIVDIDPGRCIGCKSCTHACPYDAIYLNESTGIVEKCHFCAHRVERGLAPACAVACPTEAIIPGDFHDPESRVSHLAKLHTLTARRVEVGTGPNVLYREAAPAGLDPARANAAGGLIWSGTPDNSRIRSQAFEASLQAPEARTVYDVPRSQTWGRGITAYLFFKSIAAGVFGVGGLALLSSGSSLTATSQHLAVLSLFFLLATTAFLIGDLKRPERFWFLLAKPNWSSWLVRGTLFLMAYGGLLSIWAAWPWLDSVLPSAVGAPLIVLTSVIAALVAAYTGWLFGQAKGRALWMNSGLWFHLIIQAALAGAATLVVGEAFWPGLMGPAAAPDVRLALAASLVLHATWLAVEHKLAPEGREGEYARAHRLLTRGPFAREHWVWGVGLGILVPMLCLAISDGAAAPVLGVVAGSCALVGLWIEEDLFVRAGQALPIS
ncbi:MAG: 4Fe-4S dicluster domain-containing protein [Nannocystaceae bacterium]